MKSLLLLASISVLSPLTSQAGNMFGPAPFRNGSPLVTGVDGTYQATARASNVTGIFRFAYSGGSQTASNQQNGWIFFIEGQIQKGTVVANINQSSLDGIFDSASSSTTGSTNSNGAISLPYVIINQNNSSAGNFNGKMNLKSSNGAFSGSGSIYPTPAQTNTIVGVNANTSTSSSYNGTLPPASFMPGAIIVSTGNFTNPAGSINPVSFQFRGVRTSISTPTSTSGTTSSN